MSSLRKASFAMCLAAAAFLAASCGDDDNGGTPDARPAGTPDARPAGTPDAGPGGTPDASPGGTPDASPGGTPDASPGVMAFTFQLTRGEEVPACANGGASAMGNATVMVTGDGMSATIRAL